MRIKLSAATEASKLRMERVRADMLARLANRDGRESPELRAALDDNVPLVFGTLIVALVLFGSIWIMAHLNHGMSNGQMHDMMRGM